MSNVDLKREEIKEPIVVATRDIYSKMVKIKGTAGQEFKEGTIFVWDTLDGFRVALDVDLTTIGKAVATPLFGISKDIIKLNGTETTGKGALLLMGEASMEYVNFTGITNNDKLEYNLAKSGLYLV